MCIEWLLHAGRMLLADRKMKTNFELNSTTVFKVLSMCRESGRGDAEVTRDGAPLRGFTRTGRRRE